MPPIQSFLISGTSSLTHHQPFLHNYLQVPQSRTSQTARSNSSVASMQSDLESCLGDAQFSNDLIEGKAIGLHSLFSSAFPQLPVHCFFRCNFHFTPVCFISENAQMKSFNELY
ncbi:unnamed protein product [Brugia pahangi]|uniref:Ovule protein n=1 Tax=Brugia pahangi TaxID=6280 RepID=A0A0N4TU46_BRUPA|nr:unnamed protein product [Brugia pahangi]